MLQRICLVLSLFAVAFFLGRGLTQAGWDGLGLTNAHDASSLVISVKKKKHTHHDDDDNDDDNGKPAQPQAKTTKTLCHTLVSDKVVEVFKGQCASDHPGANFNCAGFETGTPTEKRTSYRCCCY